MPRKTSPFLLALFMVLVFAAPAYAHGDVQSTTPAEGSTVKKAPDHILIQLAERAADGSKIAVTDACGEDLFQNYFTEGRTLHVNLSDLGSAGKWTVAYQIVSAEDGHLVEGNYSFRVKGKKDCSADEPADGSGGEGSGGDEDGSSGDDDQADGGAGTPTSDEGDGGGLPIPAVVVGGVVLLLMVAFFGRRASGG